jgi:D-threo-aldose 1-dehydrogenase
MVPLAAAALQMPLAHPAVCSVLAGSKSPEELDQVRDWARISIPSEFWADLARSGLLAAGTPLPFDIVTE